MQQVLWQGTNHPEAGGPHWELGDDDQTVRYLPGWRYKQRSYQCGMFKACVTRYLLSPETPFIVETSCMFIPVQGQLVGWIDLIDYHTYNRLAR